jgi:5'-AMP-activated protein kinase regulatory gamma subunit
LKIPLSQLKIGTYGSDVATAYMSTPVIEIISLFASKNISAVPVIDQEKRKRYLIYT